MTRCFLFGHLDHADGDGEFMHERRSHRTRLGRAERLKPYGASRVHTALQIAHQFFSSGYRGKNGNGFPTRGNALPPRGTTPAMQLSREFQPDETHADPSV